MHRISRRLPLALLAFCLIVSWPCGSKAQNGTGPGWTDQDISDAVEDELRSDPAVSPAPLEIETEDGIVTLSGPVDNLLAKERAARVARAVKGVRAVINQIQVHPAPKRSDYAIREDVRRALSQDPVTETQEVDVSVEDGVVTLLGTVDSIQEQKLAAAVAKGVRGVTGAINQLLVSTPESRPDQEIAADIRQALRWSVLVDHALIEVDVNDGKVALQGVVGSAAEKRWAEEAAYVAGVKGVDASELDVDPMARKPDLRDDKYAVKTDSAVQEAVKSALLHDPRTNEFPLEVSVDNGAVTLRGTVDNLWAKMSAGRDARNTVGVTEVNNRIKVRPKAELGDEEIADNVRSSLERDSYLQRKEMDVEVVAGVVHLSGTVDSYLEKTRAEDLAAASPGVLDVQNNLSVQAADVAAYDPYLYQPYTGRMSPYEYGDATYLTRDASRSTLKNDIQIYNDIRGEFFWSPFVDAEQVDVTVEDGAAILEGSVDSWAERDAATENAFEGGAVRVLNRLTVASGEE